MPPSYENGSAATLHNSKSTESDQAPVHYVLSEEIINILNIDTDYIDTDYNVLETNQSPRCSVS